MRLAIDRLQQSLLKTASQKHIPGAGLVATKLLTAWLGAYRMTVSEQTIMVASRAVEGDLDTDEHTLILDYADGTQATLLAAGSGPDQAQLELSPGTYVIHLSVHAFEYLNGDPALTPYSGSVTLRWQHGNVAMRPVTWGSFKASFRP